MQPDRQHYQRQQIPIKALHVSLINLSALMCGHLNPLRKIFALRRFILSNTRTRTTTETPTKPNYVNNNTSTNVLHLLLKIHSIFFFQQKIFKMSKFSNRPIVSPDVHFF
jgi:hypothetical protein